MASRNKIAEELYSVFLTQNYCKYVQCLHDCDAVSCIQFQESTLGKSYWLDTRNTLMNSKVNPDHMFQQFRKFSDSDPDCVRQLMVDIVKNDSSKWQNAGEVYLQLNFLNIEEWCVLMKLSHVSCDELMLYVLSVAHSRHTMVYTVKCIWTTINNINSLSVPELHSICDIHLVYLGNHMYGELKQCPLLAALPMIQSPLMIPGRPSKCTGNPVPLDLRVSTPEKAEACTVGKKGSNADSCKIIQLFKKYSTTDTDSIEHDMPEKIKL